MLFVTSLYDITYYTEMCSIAECDICSARNVQEQHRQKLQGVQVLHHGGDNIDVITALQTQILLTATVGPSIFLEPLLVLSAIDVFTTSTLSDSLKTRVRNEVVASID